MVIPRPYTSFGSNWLRMATKLQARRITGGDQLLRSLIPVSLPFIRYRLGDRGLLYDYKCPCGCEGTLGKDLYGMAERDDYMLQNATMIKGIT